VTEAMIIDLGRQAIQLILLLSGPPLLAGLAVGLLVGLFQAATQIHEITLTMIPKIVAVIAIIFFLLPWMLTTMVDFTASLFMNLPTHIR
jgi:flagellar biosynthetic protein FliQ